MLVEMPDKWNKSLVAVQVSKPLGLLIASRRLEGSIHIHEMVVDLDWRRKGVAAALMQSFVTRNHGRPLSLKVRIDNEPAIRLYSRFGFEFGEVANEYRWMRR